MPRTIEIDYAIPYERGAAQLHDIGQRAETPDGAIFRYSEMGSVQGVANKLYQGAAADTNWQDTENSVALTAGDTQITFHDDGTTFAVDEARGGHIVVESAADLGHVYRVNYNTATVVDETVMQLMPGVSVQVTVPVATDNFLTFTKNQWKDVILGITGVNTAANAGVPRMAIPAAAFGWLQTRGSCSCVVDSASEAVLVGNGVRSGQSEAGAVSVWVETGAIIDYAHMGYCEYTAASSGFAQIYLQVE